MYYKINVKGSIKELKDKSRPQENEEEAPADEGATDFLLMLDAGDLEKELRQNKQLIKMTAGEDGDSSGSESQPSEDNLDKEELQEIVPEVEKKKPEPIKEVKREKTLPIAKPGPPLKELKPQAKDTKEPAKPST